MKEKRYSCPICGFDGLQKTSLRRKQDTPSYEICPCCGFEFGFDAMDNPATQNIFRTRWVQNGFPWFIPQRKPKAWDPKKQLEKLKKKST